MKKLVALLMTIVPAFAFAAGLRISVIDKDLDFPLEGAKLTLEANPRITGYADEDGNAVLNLPDSVTSGTIRASLPGYKEVSVKFSGTGKALVINMSLADVIEGKELVVNRAAPEKTEEKVGIAKV
ncbi:MAG: hypothetical protein II077_06610, partial [Treponema sp.]|nr:hypothetical protein [Treponema sp.]